MTSSSDNVLDACQAIQPQLSLYLDGRLPADQESTVLTHLNQCSRCTQQLAMLRQVNTVIQPEEGDDGIPDFTGLVMSQFEADLVTPVPCEYDYEFVSAYVDQALAVEIPDPNLLSHRIVSFERHLPTCSNCNTDLGRLQDLRSTLSRYHSRLEESLNLDLTQAVMDQFHQQPEESDIAAGCGQFQYESFSAYVDEAADDAEAIASHIQTCEPCRSEVTRLSMLHQALGQYAQVLQTQPYPLENISLWPQIEPQLQNNVVPLRKKRAIWLTVGGTIAASLLVLFLVRMQPVADEIAMAPQAPAAKAVVAQGAAQDNVEHIVTTVEYNTPEDYLFTEQTEVLKADSLSDNVAADEIAFASN